MSKPYFGNRSDVIPGSVEAITNAAADLPAIKSGMNTLTHETTGVLPAVAAVKSDTEAIIALVDV
jgi:hypothetical protein